MKVSRRTNHRLLWLRQSYCGSKGLSLITLAFETIFRLVLLLTRNSMLCGSVSFRYFVALWSRKQLSKWFFFVSIVSLFFVSVGSFFLSYCFIVLIVQAYRFFRQDFATFRLPSLKVLWCLEDSQTSDHQRTFLFQSVYDSGCFLCASLNFVRRALPNYMYIV